MVKSFEVRQPYIENADIRLKEICDRRVKEVFGENVPVEIEKRIEWELEAINRTGMTFAVLLLKELIENNKLISEDFRVIGSGKSSYVMYLCGLNNYNPMEWGIKPYFTFGLEKDKWLEVGINVPLSLQKQIIESCKYLEGVSEIFEIGSFDKPHGVVYIPSGNSISDVEPSKSGDDVATIKGHDYYIHNKVFFMQEIKSSDNMQLIYNLSKRLGVSDKNINFEDKEIISLFNSTEILGVEPENIGGVKYGVLGMTEFDEWRKINILDDIKINSFNDLVKVIGLMNGIGAWWRNADKLMKENIVSLNDVIATREDIFEYLTSKGLSEKVAFRIADSKSKCSKIKDDDKKEMQMKGVPKWYIDSCDKIIYLPTRIECIDFAFRCWKLAYFKIHHPKEFYEEFFKVYDYDKLNEIGLLVEKEKNERGC